MRIHHLIIVFWYILPVFCGFGQKFQYVTYMDEDLPFQQVNQVIQDQKSYIWLATDQGLFRFDGSGFEDFNTSLESRYINALVHLDENSILFSNDTGIYRLYYDKDQVLIEPYLEVDEAQSDLEYPKELLLDSKGRLWVGQLNGTVFLFDRQNNKFQSYQLVGQSNTPAIIFGEDKFNTIWSLVPGMGLFYYDEERDQFRELGALKKFHYFKVIEDRILFAGDQVLQIQIGDDQQETKREYLTESGGPKFTYITVDKTGLIFLASEEDLYTLNRDHSNHLRRVFGSNDPHRLESLPFKNVNQIYFSSDQVRIGGKIWVCGQEGLGLLYSGFFTSVAGMSMDNTLSLSTTARNEVLVSQGNIYRIRNVEREDVFDEFVTNEIRVTAITSQEPYYWIGTSEAVVFRARNGVRTEFDLSDRGGGIFYMYADSGGGVWFCQAPTDKPIIGVGKLDINGKVKEYGTDEGLQSRVLVVDEGGKGELYVAGIGLDSYLYKYNKEADRFENKSLPFPFKVSRNFEVHDIAVDSRGIVWMGTTDGLLKYDTERIQRIRLGEYTMREMRSVCTLSDGSIWMATDTNGMIHLDAYGHYVLFDEKSGTPSKIASYRAMALDNANRLWVGTAEGVVHSVMPFPAPLSTKKPSLTKMVVNAREKKNLAVKKFSKGDIVDFHFTSISFPGDEVQFQYKTYKAGLPEDEIEDISWIRSLEDSKVRLRSENAGSYILDVRSQKPGGYGWSLPIAIPYIVSRPWYATWWGGGILLIFGVLVFVYGIRFFSRKKTAQLLSLLNTKERELSAKEELLHSQKDAMKHQKDALKSAGVNIYLLYRMMRQIPKKSPWSKVIPVLSKIVELPTGLDALELAFQQNSTIQHLGYIRGEEKIKQREEEFNEKENLSSYVLVHQKPLMIGNYNEECGQYISIKDSRGYLSRIYIPFKQSKGADAVFCGYSKKANRFSNQDLVTLQILTTFLSADVTNELK